MSDVGPATADAHVLQVWNINRHGGVVGVFHLQGSSWDRRRRQFLVHDKRPAPLKTVVRPKDIEGFGTGTPGQEVAAALKPSLTGGNGVAPAPPSAGRQFVASSSLSPDLQLLSLHDPVPVRLAGEPGPCLSSWASWCRVSDMPACARLSMCACNQ